MGGFGVKHVQPDLKKSSMPPNAQAFTTHCNSFCPQCGADVVQKEDKTVCTNPTCGWNCGGCKSQD